MFNKFFRPFKPYVERQFCRCTNKFELENILDENSTRKCQPDSLVRTTLIGNRNPCRACSRSESGAHLLARGRSGSDPQFPGLCRQQHKFPRIAALAINYGHRLLGAKIAALYGEIEFVALPNRSVTSAAATVPQSYASLYLTPGLRLKFFPSSRLSPWAAIGGGYALYQQSAKFSNGQNDTDKFLNRGVFDYGGGLDFRLYSFHWLAGRGA